MFRYRPRGGVLLRLESADEGAERRARQAAQIAGVLLVISRATEESQKTLLARLPSLRGRVDCLRTLGSEPVSDELLRAVAEQEWNWIDAPVTAEGRAELVHWMREQTVTETRHCYGNLMPELAE